MEYWQKSVLIWRPSFIESGLKWKSMQYLQMCRVGGIVVGGGGVGCTHAADWYLSKWGPGVTYRGYLQPASIWTLDIAHIAAWNTLCKEQNWFVDHVVFVAMRSSMWIKKVYTVQWRSFCNVSFSQRRTEWITEQSRVATWLTRVTWAAGPTSSRLRPPTLKVWSDHS